MYRVGQHRFFVLITVITFVVFLCLYMYLNAIPQTGRKLLLPKYSYTFKQHPVIKTNQQWQLPVTDKTVVRTNRRWPSPITDKTVVRTNQRWPSPITDEHQSVGASMGEYCNPHLTGEEGEVPRGYQLEAALVVIRHGDRAPIHTIPNLPTPKLSCIADQKNFQENSKFMSFLPTMLSYRGREHLSSAFKQWTSFPSNDICDSAQLTGIGSLQHLKNGKHLGDIYLQKWQLFGEEFSPDQIYIRCTEFSRTYQSAMAFLFGFLPTFNLTELDIKQSKSLVFCSDKYSRVACHCPSLYVMKQVADQQSGALLHNNSRYAEMRRRIADILDVKVGKLPYLFALVDVFSAYSCHKMNLPCGPKSCITPDLIETIWELLDRSEKQKYKTRPFQQYIHLSVHSFLVEISQSFNNLLRGRSRIRFSLFSGHDTTINLLSAALDLNNGKWVSYASRVVIELYSKTAANRRKHFFLRFLFNGEDLTSSTIFCANESINGMCRLEAFDNFVNTHLSKHGIDDIHSACGKML